MRKIHLPAGVVDREHSRTWCGREVEDKYVALDLGGGAPEVTCKSCKKRLESSHKLVRAVFKKGAADA